MTSLSIYPRSFQNVRFSKIKIEKFRKRYHVEPLWMHRLASCFSMQLQKEGKICQHSLSFCSFESHNEKEQQFLEFDQCLSTATSTFLWYYDNESSGQSSLEQALDCSTDLHKSSIQSSRRCGTSLVDIDIDAIVDQPHILFHYNNYIWHSQRNQWSAMAGSSITTIHVLESRRFYRTRQIFLFDWVFARIRTNRS